MFSIDMLTHLMVALFAVSITILFVRSHYKMMIDTVNEAFDELYQENMILESEKACLNRDYIELEESISEFKGLNTEKNTQLSADELAENTARSKLDECLEQLEELNNCISELNTKIIELKKSLESTVA